MKYILNIQKLEPGDIILVGYNDEESRQIQERTNSLYSHAMLYWYDSLIHASSIVITENPSRLLFEKDENVCVLRLNDEYRQELRISHLIEHARSFVGTLYDKEALDAMAEDKEFIPNQNRQMCAKFIAQCFESVCADLVDDYEKCSPQDLINTDVVHQINDVLIEATPQDVDFANSRDVTYLQFGAIFSIINRLRKKFPEADIMSLMQLETFLESNPVHDGAIVEIMSKTDYFDLWHLEREYCPYLYDVEAYKDSCFDNKIKMAIDIIKGSERIIKEKKAMKDHYTELMRKIGKLEYYKKMYELQDNIIENANKRIEVARAYLAENRIVHIKYI